MGGLSCFMMYWFMRVVALVVTLRGQAGLSETFSVGGVG